MIPVKRHTWTEIQHSPSNQQPKSWSAGLLPFKHGAHRLQKVASLMSEGRPGLHPSLSTPPSFCSRPSQTCRRRPPRCLGCQQKVAPEEATSVLSGCSRWRLWGRAWLSAAAPRWLISPTHQRADRAPGPGQMLCMLDISHAAQRSFLPSKAKGASLRAFYLVQNLVWCFLGQRCSWCKICCCWTRQVTSARKTSHLKKIWKKNKIDFYFGDISDNP